MTAVADNVFDFAAETAGNWRTFKEFAWSRRYDLTDEDNWALIYTHNRDSRLLDLSNAAQIEAAMKPFTDGDDPDVVLETHNHWACGHVDGFSVRVFRDGQVTEAFKVYHGLKCRLADYPVLNEEDYSCREHEATLDNIKEAAYRVQYEFNLPDEWETQVYSWLSDNDDRQVESRDDQGGYPEEDALRKAMRALNFEEVVEE